LQDDYGRPCKKRLKIDVDAALASEIKDAICAMRAIQLNEPNFHPSKTSQLLYEGKSPLVVMWEVPPFETPPGEPRYVIGNGEDIRFLLGEFSNARNFHNKLRSAFR
jgi:hypothetical protein